ncbi:HYC_CC_PP family protein [Rhodoflexus sp.]
MQKNLRHIFSLLLALQVIVASTGATFYRHYCNTEGELMAVSAYQPESSCCANHHHEDHHDHESGSCQTDPCCDLSYEFRKAETAPIAEGLKLAVHSLVFALPERFFSIPLPVFQVSDAADVQAFTNNYSPPRCYAGKSLLPVIQQFRL